MSLVQVYIQSFKLLQTAKRIKYIFRSFCTYLVSKFYKLNNLCILNSMIIILTLNWFLFFSSLNNKIKYVTFTGLNSKM